MAEEGRADAEWVDGRANVVDETGQGQRGGARAAANRIPPFHYQNRAAGARQRDGCSKAIRASADDDGVIFVAIGSYQRKRRLTADSRPRSAVSGRF